MERYCMIKALGHGSFGKVMLAKEENRECQVVIKQIDASIINAKERKKMLKEVQIMSRLRHPNLVAFLDCFITREKSESLFNIVMEYAEQGDLSLLIRAQNGLHFAENVILDWFIQILFGLQYLHKKNITHCDIKTSNIFVTCNNIVKIGDFGLATHMFDKNGSKKSSMGTPSYSSPEVLDHLAYGTKSDMWSAGCVLHELMCLYPTFTGHSFSDLIINISSGYFDDPPSCYSSDLHSILFSLLNLDSEKRSSASDVLKHHLVKARILQLNLAFRSLLKEKAS